MQSQNPSLSPDFADLVVYTPAHIRDIVSGLRDKIRAYRPSYSMRLLLGLLGQIRIGALLITMPDGSRVYFKGPEDGPHAVLRIHRDRVARRLLFGGRLGFCESYLDGEWSSPDIQQLLALSILNQKNLEHVLNGRKWLLWLSHIQHMLRPNTRGGARRNIAAHYDLGNDFYASWLDPSMTYSSAIFGEGIEDLYEAQQFKYDRLLHGVEAAPGTRLLEIGCGWGGLAERASGHFGADIDSITVSKAQWDYARERISRCGLSDRARIQLQDYRDVRGEYDGIISIEMFEAVGEAYWPVFFKSVYNCLKPGGIAGLQIIVIRDEDFENYRRSADFIQQYIFPGGMLPSIRALHAPITQSGLIQTGQTYRFGADYARTLDHWAENFQQTRSQYDQDQNQSRFKRLWELYFDYCAAGFRAGSIDVVQIFLQRPAVN